MKRGTVRLAHPGESRNVHQSVTLLEAIEEFRFDALIGGARRDEEKARAKERIFSHRDSFGQWQPKDQRPELWTLFNTRLAPGEHFRVFPISNWTELDVWQYIEREHIALPSIYYTHKREVVERRGLLVPVTELTPPRDGETGRSARRALPHRGRHHLHLPGRQPGGRCRRRGDRDAGGRRQRARRHAHGRQDLRSFDGEAQERRVLLMTRPTEPLARQPPALHADTGTALRFITCGSVDDGKSTLIGRLLVDSKTVLQDQLAGVQRGGETDLALLTDGLSAEREQGITIDVAYRYFSTAQAQVHHRRRAGPRAVHAQHGHGRLERRRRRGAGRRDQAGLGRPRSDDGEVVRRELLPQTRRHTLLCHLLRVQSIVFAVNKLDAIDDAELAFERISDALANFAEAAGVQVAATVPISALKGWNVASRHADWCGYEGPSLLELLEDLPVTAQDEAVPFAFPVQWVEKFSASADTSRGRRVFWGRVASGHVEPGQRITVLPSNQTATVAQVLEPHAPAEDRACGPQRRHRAGPRSRRLARRLAAGARRLRAGARDHRHRRLARRRAAGARAASTGRCRAIAGSRPRWRASSTA